MLSYELCKILKTFVKKNKGIYLETGFDRGISLKQASKIGFKKLISIEIDGKKIKKNKFKFKKLIKEKKVILINGDSAKTIKKKFNKNIVVFFLDAHGLYSNTKYNLFAPLEVELKFFLIKITDKQLIIIDDFLKIKYSFYFNEIYDWRSKLRYSKFKKIINKSNLNYFQLPYKNNSYLIISKNLNLKFFSYSERFFIFFKYLNIKFHYYYSIYLLKYMIKKFIKLPIFA